MEPMQALGVLWMVQLMAVMSPGPTFFLISQTAAREGRGAGLQTAMGAMMAAVVWAAASMVGLQFVLAKASWVLRWLQLSGGCYLMWIGWKLLSKPAVREVEMGGESGWFRGFLTSLSNPKIVLFFGSILASVFDPGYPAWVKVAAIGIIMVNELVWYGLVATVFSVERVRRGYLRVEKTMDRVFGAVMVGFGARLAWGARE